MIKIIKFGAEWCPPCKRMEVILDEVKLKVHSVDFEVVDIDKNPDLATQFKILAVPTLVFLKDSKEVDRMVGLVKSEEILNKIGSLK